MDAAKYFMAHKLAEEGKKMSDISVLNFGDGGGDRNIKDASAIRTVKVNGVSQTISNSEVDIDVANNLITDAQWTALATLWSV